MISFHLKFNASVTYLLTVPVAVMSHCIQPGGPIIQMVHEMLYRYLSYCGATKNTFVYFSNIS